MRRFFNRLAFVFFISTLVLLSTCDETEKTDQGFSAKEKAKYVEYAELVERSVNQRESEVIDEHFDFETLVERIISEGKEAPEYYSQGFREGVDQGYSPGSLVVGSMGEDGAYKLINVREKDGKIHAIFRTVSSLGLNYHDYVFKSSVDSFTIENYYSYLDAEDFGESIQRLYDLNLARETDDQENALYASIPKIEEMATLAEQAKFEQAFAIYDELPQEIQEQKMLLTMLLNMGYELGPSQLNRWINRFKELFPEDPLLDLKMLEFAIYDKDSTRVFESLENIRDFVGPDPYLKIIKSSVLRDSSQFEAAEILLKEAIAEEEDNDEAYWLLIDVLVERKDHAGVVSLFEKMQKVFEVNAADYTRYDDYPNLFASKEYQQWIETNPLDSLPFIEPDQFQEMMKAMEEQAQPGKSGHGHGHSHGHDHHGHQH